MASRKSLTRIEKRRRIEALFDRGGYVRVGRDDKNRPVIEPAEDSEDCISLWVSPPSPLQREMAVREAQASRARTLIEARDAEGTSDWLTVRGFLNALNMEDLIDYVLELDESEYLSQARRDVLGQAEWDDFNSLRDAMRQYDESEDKESEEWKPLLDRDKAFGAQVEERYQVLRGDARDGYKLMPRNAIGEKALDKRIEQAGSSAFMMAYEEWMLFYSVRDDEDHMELYFDKVTELKSLPAEVQLALAEKLASFITDMAEAKN